MCVYVWVEVDVDPQTSIRVLVLIEVKTLSKNSDLFFILIMVTLLSMYTIMNVNEHLLHSFFCCSPSVFHC